MKSRFCVLGAFMFCTLKVRSQPQKMGYLEGKGARIFTTANPIRALKKMPA
ncbi:hypothetical protein B0I21_11184 [Sphingobacterium paludis]|uniref:Uncharacterized protein n=1 Tax=Sphingobacterium paludis TaxID=1476465 RepID=A0A4R7CSB1_9SPHI|nr:hypothetical protein B0I21_11184 [Sphingobacterium paludis]